MKHFIVYIYLVILLFIGLNVGVPTQEKNEKQNQLTGQKSSVNSYYLTGYYNGFKPDANMKIIEHLVQRILPTFQKFPLTKLFDEKIAKLLRNKKLSKDILIAEFQVIRFEGPEIIYPFNYFW